MPNKKNSLFPQKSNVFNNNLVPKPFGNKIFKKSNNASSPSIKENDNEYLVEMPAPGMEKEDFQIQINNNVLTIKGEKKQVSQNTDTNNRTRSSFSYQSFNRSFKIDESIVDQDKIEITYTDGVLNVVIPKNEDDIQTF